MKMLVAVTCIVVLVASGLYIFRELFPRADEARLVATPQKIAQCEKAVSDAIMRPPEEKYAETHGRFAAMMITECEDYGLVSPNSKSTILRTSLRPFMETYQADRSVWAK